MKKTYQAYHKNMDANEPEDKFHFNDDRGLRGSMPYPTEHGDDHLNQLTTGRIGFLKRGKPGIVRGKIRD